MTNKAHTATIRRLAARYEAFGAGNSRSDGSSNGDSHLVEFLGGIIAVETSATLAAGVERLQRIAGRRFIAVTNKETLLDAKRLVAGTGIGVMDSQGDIVVDAAN